MNEEITIRIWDDNHKELIASDAMEFKAEGERIGSKNVLYVPKSKLDKAVKALEFYADLGNYTIRKTVRQDRLNTNQYYLEHDEGKKAREVLKEIKEGEK